MVTRALLIAGLLAAFSSYASAQGAAAAPGLLTAGSASAVTAVAPPDQKDGDAVFKSNQEAKHLTFVVGALVLNPFTLKPDLDNNPSTFDFQLQNGKTAAKGLFETGFRRRWAWEDWGAAGKTGERLELFRDLKAQLETQLAAERRKPASGRAAATTTTLDGEIDILDRKIEEFERAILPKACAVSGGKCAISWGDLALPDNYTIRLGFALAEDKPSGAASIAGAGDFYAEIGMGWDVLRVLYPTGSAPLKITFGPEFLGTVSNDPELNDFHHRAIVGFGMSVGIPLQEGGVAEIVARVGWAHVEIPEFIGDTRLVEVENEVPAFRSHQGFGFDIEMNVPVGENLGYVFIRATTNHGFDPNPWGTLVGYTVPIGSLFKGLKK